MTDAYIIIILILILLVNTAHYLEDTGKIYKFKKYLYKRSLKKASE